MNRLLCIQMINVPHSNMPGIQWPAFADQVGSQVMALQFQLEQSQWWDFEQLSTMQYKQLSPLVLHAAKTTEFYRKHYKGVQLPNVQTMESWRSLPIVKRADVQDAGDSLISNQPPKEHAPFYSISTSGSTGRQVSVQTNQVLQFLLQAFALRDELWHGRDVMGRLASIRTMKSGEGKPPEGSFSDKWGGAISAIYPTGQSGVLDISANLKQQVSWLKKFNPDILLTYPSNLVALINQMEEGGVQLKSLKAVRTLGEVVDESDRKLCREKLNISLSDIYTCQEVGYLALQCPKYNHYHIQSENVLLEVLDEYDNPCRTGEVGRVVISSLHNFITPLIRYEVGDYAEVGESCDCGRGLPVLKRILGRVRNMVTYPNGDKRWPFLGSGEFATVADVQQFQLIQTTPENIEVHLVVKPSLSRDQEIELEKILARALVHSFNFSFFYHDEIKRSAGGKYEDFVSRVQG